MTALPTVKTILAALDLTPDTEQVVFWAAAQAKAFGARLELLYITEPEPDFVGYAPGPQHERQATACRMQDERRAMDRWKSQLQAEGLRVTEHVFQGVPEEKILMEARRLDADLIVAGHRRHDFFHRLFVGSVGEELLRQAPCPILFVSEKHSE